MKRQRGYTLLEVIVAFALLALALTLLLGTLSGGVRQVRAADQATRASLHAQSLLAGLGMDEPLRPGQREGTFEQGRYRWRLEIQPWRDPQPPPQPAASMPGAPRLLQLDLDVRWGEGVAERIHWRSLRLAPAGQVP